MIAHTNNRTRAKEH